MLAKRIFVDRFVCDSYIFSILGTVDMKSFIRNILCIVLLITFSSNISFAEKLLIAGCGWKKIMLIDKKTGAKEWVYEIPNYVDCNCVDITPDGKIVYSNKISAALVGLNKDLIWEYKVSKGEELHTARSLENGNFLLAICGHPARFVELSKEGKLISETKFDTGIERVHAQFRFITKNKSGNYLVALWGKRKIVEVSKSGELVREIPLRSGAFGIKELKNGNYLVSCGDAKALELIDSSTGQLLRRIDNSNLESDFKILFAASAQQLDNGDIIFANWNGHSKDKSQPKLMQIDQNNRVVWFLENDEGIANISALKCIKDL